MTRDARRWPGDPIPPADRPPIGPAIGDPNADKDEDKSETIDRPDLSLAVNAERSTLSVSPLQKATEPEEKFHAEVFDTICGWTPAGGRLELVNWGGCWRNRYRQNPDKARRVLAELRAMIREGRIHGHPGAAAFDLWKRLPQCQRIFVKSQQMLDGWKDVPKVFSALVPASS